MEHDIFEFAILKDCSGSYLGNWLGRREAKQKAGKCNQEATIVVLVSYSCLNQGGGSDGEKKWTDSTYILEEVSKALPNGLNRMDRRRESVKENNPWA